MSDTQAEITKEDAAATPVVPLNGVTVSRIVSITGGAVWVTNRDGKNTHAACLVAMDALAVGDQVAVMFEGGDPMRPVIIGRMQDQDVAAATLEAAPQSDPFVVTSSTEQTVISHPRKLRLKCGKAAITLTADGRVELSGDYLLSNAKGTNRIAGASVKIN